jgi:hypothetical protein
MRRSHGPDVAGNLALTSDRYPPRAPAHPGRLAGPALALTTITHCPPGAHVPGW